MPTIMFDSNFSELEKTILSKTFKANSKKLEMHNDDFSVYVRKVKIKGGPKHYARVAYPEKGTFLVEINKEGFNLFDATSSLGHETVHMKQYVDGRLKDDEEGSYWQDALYPHFTAILAGNDVPWEQEAWGMQGELHRHAIATLSPQEREHINPEQSNGLNRLL